MKIRQEETTPIGNYYHDCGVEMVFNALGNTVDDFEVDTDELNDWIDRIITNLKGLKSQIKKCENEYCKYLSNIEINDMIKRGAE